jgi:hypothetical protein
LFIYQPKTIDNAIAFPGDVLLSIKVFTLVPPTLIVDVAVIAIPVTFPLKVVAVAIPVTDTPFVNVGAPASSLSTISSTCIFDISLLFLSIYEGYAMRTIPEPPEPPSAIGIPGFPPPPAPPPPVDCQPLAVVGFCGGDANP